MLDYARNEALFFKDFQANFRFMANLGYCTPVKNAETGKQPCFDPAQQLVSVKPCRSGDGSKRTECKKVSKAG